MKYRRRLTDKDRQEILDNAIEVLLPSEDSFRKVRETLTRIGIANKKEKKLYQSCHILHKKGRYYIVHFKELFMLDGLATMGSMSIEDSLRRTKIAKMLEDWGLVKIVTPISKNELERAQKVRVFVLKYEDKHDWLLIPKYHIGKKVRKNLQ